MGNAMKFLKERKEPREVDLSNTKITKCEDFTTIPIKGWSSSVVYGKASIGSIKGINARRFENREKKNCACCGEEFTPARYTGFAGVVKYSTYCFRCRAPQMNDIRPIIVKVGGLDKYNELRAKVIYDKKLLTDKETLEEQIALRDKLGMEHKRLDKKLKKLIEENSKSVLGYEFDF